MSTLRIYNEHFGLTERPFTLLPDPDSVSYTHLTLPTNSRV